MRAVAVVFLGALAAGCASPSLYDWGNYDSLLYQSYKSPAAAADLKASLEARIAAADQAGESGLRRVPPGIYAELGTLYLQEGDAEKALALYRREREAWPESRGLMDAMIGNLERMQVRQGVAQK